MLRTAGVGHNKALGTGGGRAADRARRIGPALTTIVCPAAHRGAAYTLGAPSDPSSSESSATSGASALAMIVATFFLAAGAGACGNAQSVSEAPSRLCGPTLVWVGGCGGCGFGFGGGGASLAPPLAPPPRAGAARAPGETAAAAGAATPQSPRTLAPNRQP
eukprot:COSAG01_NODE_27058_length_695_cov_4.377517_1_plen_161_part_01